MKQLLHPNQVNPLNAELNPICHLLALLGAHPILHVSRIRVNPMSVVERHSPQDELRSVHIWIQLIYVYTGCPRTNVPDFGKVFLVLKYTDITQNTYIQS
jgi:hypothetical protein